MKCFKAVYLVEAVGTPAGSGYVMKHSGELRMEVPSGFPFASWSYWEHPPVFYKVGTKIFRPEGCGPLAAFATLQEALDFVYRHTESLSSCAILEGEGELSGEKEVDKPWQGLWWKGFFKLSMDFVPDNTLFLESFITEIVYPLGK